MEIRSILDVAKDLIKAIDENTMSVQIRENDFGPAVPSQYIADELEELRDWVNKRTLEKRQTN